MLDTLVGAYADAALREFRLPRWSPDCCIAATRLGVLLFKRLRIRVRPLPLVVSGLNTAAREMLRVHGGLPDKETQQKWWDEKGAWIIHLGLPSTPREPGRWPGHLGLVVNEEWLVDVTCMQASRPERGIIIPPIVHGVTAGFRTGAEEMDSETPEGALLSVVALPEHSGYQAGKDWQELSRYDLPLERVLFRMERSGALGKRLLRKK
jgi:hypothetical protein